MSKGLTKEEARQVRVGDKLIVKELVASAFNVGDVIEIIGGLDSGGDFYVSNTSRKRPDGRMAFTFISYYNLCALGVGYINKSNGRRTVCQS